MSQLYFNCILLTHFSHFSLFHRIIYDRLRVPAQYEQPQQILTEYNDPNSLDDSAVVTLEFVME